MIKVKLSIYMNNGYEDYIEINMPYLPKEGELFGLWIKGEWIFLNVKNIVHELDKNNNFLITEINLED